jgi:hypothetical protein
MSFAEFFRATNNVASLLPVSGVINKGDANSPGRLQPRPPPDFVLANNFYTLTARKIRNDIAVAQTR